MISMPRPKRPKRQRPSWLPRWMPFKDGRYLGLAKQTILAWSSTILALIFFSMTVSFALGTSRLWQIKAVNSAQSNSILILRVFSETAGLFLAGTVHSTFAVIQWVLVSRPEGIRFPQFLALQPSTGPLGLLVLASGKGLPVDQWPFKPRLLSLLRLIAEVAVPLMGVLIMSNVSTEEMFIPIEDTIKPMTFGMEAFNGSVASELLGMRDMFFNMGYVAFLSDPLHAIDTTPRSARHGHCSRGMSLDQEHGCLRRLLLAQELQNVNANLPLSRESDSQVVLSMNQQVFSLEFQDNIETTKDDMKCKDFNSGPAWYTFCIGGDENGRIFARMVACPANLVVNQGCANDTAWRMSKGFSTSLELSYTYATVGYQRFDGRILWHEVESTPRPGSINASDVLDALGVILATNSTSPGLLPPNPILGSPTNFFGRLVAGHMYRVSRLNQSTNVEAHLKGTNALQNLLGITLFYCQNGILGQTVLPFVSNSTNITAHYGKGAFEKTPNTSLVSFADTWYKLNVGRATLYAYIALSGITLLICIIALIFGSLVELAKLDAEPTLYPTLDFYTQCRVEHGNGKVVSAHERVELAWIHDGRQMFRDIEPLRVRRRKRMARPLEPDLIRPEDTELPVTTEASNRS